ncbi:MAG TPA: YfcC family protein, partial [Planctomycetota bacterium]|nr:YfcC family protein [Planctomycetota bacterium]
MPRVRVPHTLVLLFGMIVVAWVLTRILPQGTYERITDEKGHERVVPGTFRTIEERREEFAAEGAEGPERLAPTAIFTAVPTGLAEAQGIVFFILIIGGAFAIFRETGAADAAITATLGRLGHRPQSLVAAMIFAFALGSATIGAAEEYLPFIPILVGLALGLGLDGLTAAAMVCVGYAVGYAAAPINPFTVVVAQEVSELPVGSGMAFRVALFPILYAIGVAYVLRYIRRVRRDPSTSLVADLPKPSSASFSSDVRFGPRHLVALVLTAAAITLLIVGVERWEWYTSEFSAVFLGLGVLLALAGGLTPNRAADAFCRGAAELTTTAILVGVARGIEVTLDAGQVKDTIVHGISEPLAKVGPNVAAVGMFFVQSVINLFIPSGSGQAYVTMPILAPLADTVSLSRQTAVLAFQLADGISNILFPTNAVLIGILSMAGVPFGRWVR